MFKPLCNYIFNENFEQDSISLKILGRFCPSVFLYLSSVVPAIWLLELDKVGRRLKAFETNVNISENFDLTNLAAEDLKHLEKALGVSTSSFKKNSTNLKIYRMI